MHSRVTFLSLSLMSLPAMLQGQASAPQRDPLAISLINQSLSALTGGTAINDVTLQATATYIAGSDQETGTATLLAKPGESRITLTLSGGQRAEVRNNSGGFPQGWWSGPDGIWHPETLHNCWTDPTWFFPALSFEVALNDPQVAITYIGQETRSGQGVQHLRFYRVLSGEDPDVVAAVESLSTVDVYLDAASSLPLFVDFFAHPDGDFGIDEPVEMAFSAYRSVNGVVIPSHFQRTLNGCLDLDVAISTATPNSGLSSSEFLVQ